MINFAQKIAKIKEDNLYRIAKKIQGAQGVNIQINNKNLINFSSNDYLSLANHPQIKEALIIAIDKYGIGSGASHLVSGHFEPHQQLEEALANYCNTKKSLLFSSGYLANLAVFSALKQDIGWILQDRLNHASLLDGNQLINKRVNRYAHNDMNSFANKHHQLKLTNPNTTGLIVSDVIFSMDGDSANITQLANFASISEDLLLLDGAHSFGLQTPPFILASTSAANNIIYMATLGKAVGTMGAFVTGDDNLIDYLMQKARPFIYTTALPPALCMASLASLSMIKSGVQQQKLTNNINFFKQVAKHHQLNFSPSDTAIQPLIIGHNAQTIQQQKNLEKKGFLVAAIREPTVPKNTARLRITLNANHSQDQIEQLLHHLQGDLCINNDLA